MWSSRSGRRASPRACAALVCQMPASRLQVGNQLGLVGFQLLQQIGRQRVLRGVDG